MSSTAPTCNHACAVALPIVIAVLGTALILVSMYAICLKVVQARERKEMRVHDVEKMSSSGSSSPTISAPMPIDGSKPEVNGLVPIDIPAPNPVKKEGCPKLTTGDRIRTSMGLKPKCPCRRCQDNPRQRPLGTQEYAYQTSRFAFNLPLPEQPSADAVAHPKIEDEVLPIYIRDEAHNATTPSFNTNDLPGYPLGHANSAAAMSMSDYSQRDSVPSARHPAAMDEKPMAATRRTEPSRTTSSASRQPEQVRSPSTRTQRAQQVRSPSAASRRTEHPRSTSTRRRDYSPPMQQAPMMENTSMDHMPMENSSMEHTPMEHAPMEHASMKNAPVMEHAGSPPPEKMSHTPPPMPNFSHSPSYSRRNASPPTLPSSPGSPNTPVPTHVRSHSHMRSTSSSTSLNQSKPPFSHQKSLSSSALRQEVFKQEGNSRPASPGLPLSPRPSHKSSMHLPRPQKDLVSVGLAIEDAGLGDVIGDEVAPDHIDEGALGGLAKAVGGIPTTH